MPHTGPAVLLCPSRAARRRALCSGKHVPACIVPWQQALTSAQGLVLWLFTALSKQSYLGRPWAARQVLIFPALPPAVDFWPAAAAPV